MTQQTSKAKFGPGERVAVLLPKPFDQAFDYVLPEGMTVASGAYVRVPFGKHELIGVVWGEGTQHVDSAKCKLVCEALSDWPAMSATLRSFIDKAAAYTLSPKGLMLKMAMPLPDILRKPVRETRYRLGTLPDAPLPAKRQAIVEALGSASLEKKHLQSLTHASTPMLKAMTDSGVLQAVELMATNPEPAITGEAPKLRPEQQRAADTLASGKGFQPFLLDGITGSGKTEVYFDRIARALSEPSAQILILLPEILLTVQWLKRFETRFGFTPHVWHSSVSVAQRKRSWQMIANGSGRVIVGARSALFLPYRNLRLLIVDEEHEASYKQEEGVLYHARDMAVLRAKEDAIPIILASATPSLESTVNAQQGKYQEIQLRERHGAFEEIPPQLIDLRQDKPDRGSWLSPTLRRALQQTLAAGHQSLLFLNRRGYAPLLLCRTCGHRFQCPNCDAWMVTHSKPPRLQCHQCDWRMPLPSACPECDHEDSLVACGPGVERIAEEATALFPQARLVTLSSDEGELPQQIDAILRGEADIIIGTQMVAKGHDFGQLALVGIVDGDLGLFGGDLRASERCYQLMHQLAGRAGRDAIEGQVFLQTTQPEHPVMQALQVGDRPAFVEQELRVRQKAGWPPYGRLAAILLEGFDEVQVKAAAQQLVRHAPRVQGVSYLGPAPALIARSRNRWRYRILVKAGGDQRLQPLIRQWLATQKLPSSIKLKVDIDPLQLV